MNPSANATFQISAVAIAHPLSEVLANFENHDHP